MDNVKIDKDGVTILPDGSAFCTVSFPLPKDHWIYSTESESSPMPMQMGTDNPERQKFVKMLREAGKYAVRSATMKGKDMDFDPDALIQNLIIGFLGYYTPDGLSDV